MNETKNKIKLLLKNEVKRLIKTYSINKTVKRCKMTMKNNVAHFGPKLPELTENQINELRMKWGKYYYKPDLNAFRWFYAVGEKEDWRYITEDFYAGRIMPKLYEAYKAIALDDKNLYDLYFYDVPMPETIVRKINGSFMNKRYEIITYEKFIEIIKNIDEMIVIKPSVNSLRGDNVRLIEPSKIEDYLALYNGDFIIQRKIIQHSIFSSLNESSSNVVRITSFLFHNDLFMFSPTIRVGDSGSFTDQGGKRQFCIGIDHEGRMKNSGLATKISIYKETVMPNGFSFGGIEVPGFDEMKKMVELLHPRLASCPIIGWDFITDCSGKAILIECNLHWTGIVKYQECNGPLFGEKTEYILDRILKS